MFKSKFTLYPDEKKSNEKKLKNKKNHLSQQLNINTLDFFRHDLMKSFLKKVIINFKDHSFLTVGDGRFGLDANFLIKNGAKNVHSTDLDDTLLKIGFEKGLINSFSAQNCEALQFEDNSFDFSLCKESLHHFPRPYRALEELMRVSRKAVFLIEPRDNFVDRAKFQSIHDFLRRIFLKKLKKHIYEPSGNYLYTFSERELEKFLLAVNLNKIGFISRNDVYFKGMEYTYTNSNHLNDLIKIKKFKLKKSFFDLLTFFKLVRSNILITALLKNDDLNLQKGLEKSDFEIKQLIKNPNPYD